MAGANVDVDVGVDVVNAAAVLIEEGCMFELPEKARAIQAEVEQFFTRARASRQQPVAERSQRWLCATCGRDGTA